MKTITDFALKEEYKYIQSVWYRFTEIQFLIYWKSFHIIFASMNLDKTNLGGKTETWVIFMLKIFVLQKLHVFSTLNLRNNVFIEFISENFLVFLSTYQRVSRSILQKKLLIATTKIKYGDICRTYLIYLV